MTVSFRGQTNSDYDAEYSRYSRKGYIIRWIYLNYVPATSYAYGGPARDDGIQKGNNSAIFLIRINSIFKPNTFGYSGNEKYRVGWTFIWNELHLPQLLVKIKPTPKKQFWSYSNPF